MYRLLDGGALVVRRVLFDDMRLPIGADFEHRRGGDLAEPDSRASGPVNLNFHPKSLRTIFTDEP